MTEFEKDRKLEKEIMAIINYYKLVYIEKLTYDKDLDTFIMLGGKNLIERLKTDSDNRYIALDKTNFRIISNLVSKLDRYKNKKISSNTTFIEEINKLGWLTEAIEGLNEDEKLYDTIVSNANNNVYTEIIEKTFNSEITNFYKECLMKQKVYNMLNTNNK